MSEVVPILFTCFVGCVNSIFCPQGSLALECSLLAFVSAIINYLCIGLMFFSSHFLHCLFYSYYPFLWGLKCLTILYVLSCIHLFHKYSPFLMSQALFYLLRIQL